MTEEEIKEWIDKLKYREKLLEIREMLCTQREQLFVTNPYTKLSSFSSVQNAFSIEYHLPLSHQTIHVVICPVFHKNLQKKSVIDILCYTNGIYKLMNLNKTFPVSTKQIQNGLQTDGFIEYKDYILIQVDGETELQYCLTGHGLEKIITSLHDFHVIQQFSWIIDKLTYEFIHE